jgi:predicted enzyme related to lactoylglutathione lyase
MQLINWFEIPVADFNKAMFFYSDVFRHIRFDIRNFNGIAHAVFRSSNINDPFAFTGALVETPNKDKEHSGPILFFNITEGMSNVLERVERGGGIILKKKQLVRNELADGRYMIPKTLIDGNSGYYSHFRDPDGNQIGLYSNS